MAQFQVDLRGIVEILSRHLYSSPRVFVRELLQNGVDAITERRRLDPTAPAAITITVGPAEAGGEVSFADTGVGLTAPEVESLLATIGRSSKRDEFDLQREGLLGQFGIGLLSAFLVSDAIEVRTRSSRHPDAPTVSWIGRGDGTYDTAVADVPLAAPGTVVTLRPRPGEQWLRPAMVRDLARYYGSLLRFPITVVDATGQTTDVAPQRAPWELATEEQTALCREAFGFEPLATIPLHVEVAGVTGVAFVLPTSANPSEPARHRVFLRRMLLAESAEGLLPDWAYFVRAVVDVEELRPTASREALYDDETLAVTREQLGAQIRTWLLRTAATDPTRLEHFVAVHHLGVKQIALHDDDMLDIARTYLPWSTTTGTATMAELLRRSTTLDYTATTTDYGSLATVARAQDLTVIDAGYVYDAQLLDRFAEVDPRITFRQVNAADIVGRLGPAESDSPALEHLARVGTAALDEQSCVVEVRGFEPVTTPALYVADPDRRRREVDARGRSAAESNPLLAGLLDAPALLPSSSRDTLVLNALNPVVSSAASLDDVLAADVVRGLYATALLAAGEPMSEADRGLLSRAFLALIERAR